MYDHRDIKNIRTRPVDFWAVHDAEVIGCRKCPRLVAWREKVAVDKRKAYMQEEYWGKPVPGFGDPHARILVVGLAPGAHGSNRTGRMFTGDASGEFLFQNLFRSGFASQPVSVNRDDALRLMDLYISSACRCVPPGNKPNPDEINNCKPFIQAEYEYLRPAGIVTLGRLAYEQCIKMVYPQTVIRDFPTFGHGTFVEPGDVMPWILASYHPSRQNTQTGKLTSDMFNNIWETAKNLL